MDGFFLPGPLGVQVGDDILAVVDPPDTGRIHLSQVFGYFEGFTSGKYRSFLLPVYNGVKAEGTFLKLLAVPVGWGAASHQDQKGGKQQ